MAKRGLELLQSMTGLSPGSKDRKIEFSREELQELIKDLGTEDFSASSSPLSSKSTASGDNSHLSNPMGSTTPKTPGGGGGRGGGNGGGNGGRDGGKKQVCFRKEASDREKIGMLEIMMMMMMMMVFRPLLVHDAEHRRKARELNDVLEFSKTSTDPAKLHTQKAV